MKAMPRNLLAAGIWASVFVFLAGFRASAADGAQLPEWIANPPPGFVSEIVLGTGYSRGGSEEAMDRARENAVRKIVERLEIRIEPATFHLGREDTMFRIRSSLVYHTPRFLLRDFRVMEEYVRVLETGEYEGFVLISYHRRTPRRAPSAFAAGFRSMLAPGWGHLSLGERRFGSRILTISATLLAGAVVSWLAAETYHDRAVASGLAETIRFNNDRSRMFRYSAAACVAGYGVLGGYAVFDVVGSRYLKQYL